MMDIRIFQINLDRDENGVAFESYEHLPAYQGSEDVNSELYDLVFSGHVAAKNLEDVYRTFNIDIPEDYRGRSLSVSDVVEVSNSSKVASGFYYCDNIGFRRIYFEADKTKNLEENGSKERC